MKLKDKVAIVTGSGRGIGQGIARVFASEGASVVIVCRREEEGCAMVEEINQGPGHATYIRADVSDSKSVRGLIDQTIETFGQLDILVNNAGYHISKNIEQTSEEEWEFIINTNLRSTFLCSKYAISHLRKTKGCIINISSMVGLVGQPNAGGLFGDQGGTNRDEQGNGD